MRPSESSGTTSDPAAAAWRRDEYVIGVDERDAEIGPVPRLEAHGSHAPLHRAFMVLLVDEDGRLLLSRRSEHKLLWPLNWADSCAGHPRPGEDVIEAAQRRVHEELGCTSVLRSLGSFVYRAAYEDVGVEHELCHVLTGPILGAPVPDEAEVAGLAVVAPEILKVVLAQRPDEFVPWLGGGLWAFMADAQVISECFGS